jgi:hypothetical protein
MRNFDLRASLEDLKRGGVGLKLLILVGVAAAVGYFLSGMVTVSFQSNAAAWAYQWAVVLALIGLAVWAAAKFIGYPPEPSD